MNPLDSIIDGNRAPEDPAEQAARAAATAKRDPRGVAGRGKRPVETPVEIPESVVREISERTAVGSIDRSADLDWVYRNTRFDIDPDFGSCPSIFALELWRTLKGDVEARQKWILEQSSRQTAVDVKRDTEAPGVALERRMRDDGREKFELIERVMEGIRFHDLEDGGRVELW